MTFKNILLVDTGVPNFKVFEDSLNENTCVVHYSLNITRFDELLKNICEKISVAERIGLVFRKEDNILIDGLTIIKSEERIISLIKRFNVKHLDILACNTLKHPEWKELYAQLKDKTGVNIYASCGNTGNLNYGDNWNMEMTIQEVETNYFKEPLEYYKFL